MLEGSGLASALGREDDINLRIGLQQFVGAVVAAVGDPHDAELVAGIVKSQRVLHLICNDVFLIIGTDHQCDGGKILVSRENGLLGFPLEEPFQPDDEVQQYSVTDVGVEHDEQHGPEQDFQCQHSLFSERLLRFNLFLHVDKLLVGIIEFVLQEG